MHAYYPEKSFYGMHSCVYSCTSSLSNIAELKSDFFALKTYLSIITNTADWGPIVQSKESSNNSDFGQFLD
jgi:hypothetical protein